MNSTTTEIVKRFRSKYVCEVHEDHDCTNRLIKGDAKEVTDWWLAEIEAARREAINEITKKLNEYDGKGEKLDFALFIFRTLDSLKPTEEECKCYCHMDWNCKCVGDCSEIHECQHCRKV